MADEETDPHGQPDSRQDDVTEKQFQAFYTELEKNITQSNGQKKELDVYICNELIQKHGLCLNLDTLDKIRESINAPVKETKTDNNAKDTNTDTEVETFDWSDDDLKKLEELSDEKYTVDKDDFLGKVYNDPIHGNIRIHPVCQAIIDTPQFQRLRDLKQMGMVSHVYPGAVHTRFEHSLGVCYLAGEFARTLQRNQPFLGITNKDILCVQIAGLCHDLGHGPFSHLFDEVVKDLEKKKFWKHEKRSVELLKHLLKSNKSKLAKTFIKYDLWKEEPEGEWKDQDDLTFIEEMISTEGKTGRRNKLKHFLYEIVSNDSTGVDVDKFDYLARDSLHLGMKSNFDHRRFMMFSRVNFINGVGHLCVRNKEVPNLYNMYITRYTHQKFVWNHHVNKCVELMISEVIKLAAPYLKLEWEVKNAIKSCPIKECTEPENIEGFSRLTDSLITQILHYKQTEMTEDQRKNEAKEIVEAKRQKNEGTDFNEEQEMKLANDIVSENIRAEAKDMKKAKDILCRISNRNFYKTIYESKPFESENEKQLKTDMEKCTHDLIEKCNIEKDNVIVKYFSYDLGKKDKKPLDYMPVYSKKQPYLAVKQESAETTKILVPYISLEYNIRVIYRGEKRFQEEIDKLTEAAKEIVDKIIKRHTSAKNAPGGSA